MNPEQFNELKAQGYNRIPVMHKVLADLDTPLSTYLKLANGPYSFLFESVEGGERWGRYSIIGLPCKKIVKFNGYEVTIEAGDQPVQTHKVKDPIAYLKTFLESYKAPELPGMPRFNGGLVGYFGYDSVGFFEPKLSPLLNKPDELETPDILFMVCEEILVFDNLEGTLSLVVHADTNSDSALQEAQNRLVALEQKLRDQVAAPDIFSHHHIQESDFSFSIPEETFKRNVEKIRAYILAGDVMQVVPSQRMSVPYEDEPIHLYRALRYLNPSPYLFYLNLKDFHIVGSSPEILTRTEDNTVTVRPLAGTRKRGRTQAQDKALEKELLADPKEIAEHLMLIDLGRNDVGRVAETGSVRVTQKMIVEKYSHVMHIVSNVEARMKPGLGPFDVLAATFPAGTLSGAPKIRAMEIIAELEPAKRGVYGGAVGYISWHGEMDMAIAIRTAVIKDKVLYLQAGAGVVADSIPELEWRETLNKGRAVFKAVTLSARGFESV